MSYLLVAVPAAVIGYAAGRIRAGRVATGLVLARVLQIMREEGRL